jgi:hypothetical protein
MSSDLSHRLSFRSRSWANLPFMADFFSFEPWELLAQILGELPFDQVILRLFLVSCILAQSTKIWWHCIIAFLHYTIPYASSHKCVYNLEQECKYHAILNVSYTTLLSSNAFIHLFWIVTPWTLSSTSPTGFALCIPCPVSYSRTSYLWR